MIRWIDKTLFPGYVNNWDDLELRERVKMHATQQATLLDVGAGAGIVTHMDFRGLVARIIGVDPDPRVKVNPYLDEAHVGYAEAIPLPSGSVDLAVCDNVFEHLDRPEVVLRETYRVLRSGGVLVAKTPNRWHYVAVIARLTPLRFHRWVTRMRGRKAEDTFPTRYLANTPRRIRALAEAAGFRVESIEPVGGRPEYLRVHWLPYLLGGPVERFINRWVPALRVVLISTLRKP